MSLWIGLALLAAGLIAFAYGSGNRFGSFRGNFAQRVGGNVTQTYNEGGATPPQPQRAGEDRFLKWAGLIVAFAGLVVSILKLITG